MKYKNHKLVSSKIKLQFINWLVFSRARILIIKMENAEPSLNIVVIGVFFSCCLQEKMFGGLYLKKGSWLNF